MTAVGYNMRREICVLEFHAGLGPGVWAGIGVRSDFSLKLMAPAFHGACGGRARTSPTLQLNVSMTSSKDLRVPLI
jgi:hypothetical protein